MASSQISVEGSWVTVQCQGLTARLPAGEAVRFAHFGCKLLGCLRKKEKDLPPAVPRGSRLDLLWKGKLQSNWADTRDATGKLAKGLAQAVGVCGASGLVLYDTMRSGSDYWRPGKLLTDAANGARALRTGISVGYAREDELCPPPELLQTFRTGGMSFGQYATQYAEYLRRGSPAPVEAAAAAAVLAQARGCLAAFYCTDPHVPGYGDPAAMIAGTPYDKRHWLDADERSLRDAGCHRVILSEEVARFFAQRGIPAEVIEIDQSLERCHRRVFAATSTTAHPEHPAAPGAERPRAASVGEGRPEARLELCVVQGVGGAVSVGVGVSVAAGRVGGGAEGLLEAGVVQGADGSAAVGVAVAAVEQRRGVAGGHGRAGGGGGDGRGGDVEAVDAVVQARAARGEVEAVGGAGAVLGDGNDRGPAVAAGVDGSA